MSKIDKNGNVESNNIYESYGTNVLQNTEQYTVEHPYVLTGTGSDIIAVTNQYAKVTPGKTYYLVCQTDKEWNSDHGNGIAKPTIWLYMSKTYDANNEGYDNPVNFTSGNWVTKGIWKYTVPSGYNMARIRYNTYSDGSATATAKFWNTKLIPEEYFAGYSTSNKMKLANSYISVDEIIEY